MNKGKTPVQLDFFVGRRNEKFQSKATQLGLSENNIEFLKYLQFDICATLLERNKIKIHIEMGQFFFANFNSAESIYNFLLVWQDTSKKILIIEFKTSHDYDKYFTKYLAAIKNINDDKYDMSTNKNSKFLCYNFNDYLSLIGKPPQLVSHTVISDDDYALTELQNRNWPYFNERILEFSQNGLELRNYSITDKS